jgi:hypothetical protein
METARDLLTNQAFTKKRSNQKFSSPENRIKFYNRKASQQRLKLAKHELPLKQSFKAIEKLLTGKKEGTYNKHFLQGCGVSFSHFTHYTKLDGKNFPSIFDFVLISINENDIKIVRDAS